MRRGEIRWVDLDPVRGAESSKRRPAVIVSNDGANATANRLGRGVVTVVPVTSNTERIHPFQVLLTSESTGLRDRIRALIRRITRPNTAQGAKMIPTEKVFGQYCSSTTCRPGGTRT